MIRTRRKIRRSQIHCWRKIEKKSWRRSRSRIRGTETGIENQIVVVVGGVVAAGVVVVGVVDGSGRSGRTSYPLGTRWKMKRIVVGSGLLEIGTRRSRRRIPQRTGVSGRWRRVGSGQHR